MNTHLLERLDARLKEFISTEELPYGGGLCGSSYDKPNYPSLYLSRSTDPGLMKLPGEGSAMVRYKVKRREIDESREDGQPLYGASIEIQSLEPVEEEEEFERQTSNIERRTLKEFAGGYVNTDEGVKKERGAKAHLTRNAGKYVGGVLAPGSLGLTLAGGYLIDRRRRKKNVKTTGEIESKQPWKATGKAVHLEETVFLREFGSANSNLLVGLPDDWVTTGREKALFDRKGNVLKHKRVDYKSARKGEPNLSIQKENKDGTWSIDENFGHSPSRLRRTKAIGLAGATGVAGYVAGKHGGKIKEALRKRPLTEVTKTYRKAMGRGFESTLFLRQFAEARDRDPEGRFAAGRVPGAKDYALAGMMARNKKKLAGAAAGVGALAGGAALARSARGKQIFDSLGQGALRAIRR
jgi:hypothetical protein